MGELVVTSKSQFDGDTDTLDGHDGDGADSAADGNVNQRVLASVARAYAVDHDSRKDDDQNHVEKEAWPTSIATFNASSLMSRDSPG